MTFSGRTPPASQLLTGSTIIIPSLPARRSRWRHERSRSLAIAPDRQSFVFGTEWALRGYDKDGKVLWLKQAPVTQPGASTFRETASSWSPPTATAPFAGIGFSDGEELLALFVHAKDRRWVAWTPKGYYMASPGAELLIGWHVNRGWDEAAQFYSADRFRDQFNRPDIVKLVLETLDEGKAIEEANRRANVKRAVEDVREIAPPIVMIQKPGDNTTFRTSEVTVEYDVFSPTGQKITDVDFLINNAALGARFASPVNAGKYTSGRVTLTLPPEDVTITLVATRAPGRVSRPPFGCAGTAPSPGRSHCRACARCSSASMPTPRPSSPSSGSRPRTPPTSPRSSRRRRARATARSKRSAARCQAHRRDRRPRMAGEGLRGR